jgi:hypothetical protein
MTNDEIALQGLLEKSSDASLLREMIGFAAQRLMQLETDVRYGAAHGERSAGDRGTGATRSATRLSSRSLTWITVVARHSGRPDD